MKIQLAQISSQDGVTAPNLQKVLSIIAQAPDDTDLIVFPETCLMGFPSAEEVKQVAETEDGPTLAAVKAAVKAKNISVALGFAEIDNGKFYNTTVLVSPEGIALKYRKTHLWATDVGVFEPGNQMVTGLWKGLRVGILICFDIEFPETARALAMQGADLLIVTNGNMDPYGPVHRALITARAMENQVFAVMVNRCGTGCGLTFAGDSAVVNPFGEVLTALGREEEIRSFEIDLDDLQKSRADYRYTQLRRIPLTGELQSSEQGQTAFVFS
ncbi:carbon-nitrogen hydrolase family protein [Leeia oryzae]|uniref:carbon-nitrogen hydrolase family protein n=1 Tax=Leeia oryzae TaxID=356662 RepID=UPI00037E5962|nr:carbon-nitrogen hydrolase family protein [Leeia oryzae]